MQNVSVTKIQLFCHKALAPDIQFPFAFRLTSLFASLFWLLVVFRYYNKTVQQFGKWIYVLSCQDWDESNNSHVCVLTLNTYRNIKMTFCGFKGSYMVEPFLGKQLPAALTGRNFPKLNTAWKQQRSLLTYCALYNLCPQTVSGNLHFTVGVDAELKN